MLFNSYIFWVFFGIVYLLYRGLGFRGQNRMLLVASYVFYGFWDYRFLALMFVTSVIDFYIGISIDAAGLPPPHRMKPGAAAPIAPATEAEIRGNAVRRRWMLLSVAMNLGLLGFFKYFNFFSENAQALLLALGFNVTPWTLSIILPVGISFYTFQEMSYIIDIYRGDLKPARNFVDFALFISFFPHLVAGPIQHSTWLLPQIQNPRPRNESQFAEGLYHVILGLFKKVVIDDNMASIADAVFFSNPAKLTGPECLIGVYAFAFQIYGDFSGYSSIAQGIAKWLGFDFMDNFKMPYFAVSPSDFWQRWHIGLSTWLRDYLYIPLGGNRGGGWKTYRNLMLTMLLGGLWHGAAWTFVAWGLFHGLLLCGYRLFEQPAPKKNPELPAKPITELQKPLWMRLALMCLMFHFVCLGWLFFRADSMGQAWTMAARMLTDFTVTPLVKSSLAMIVFYTGPLWMFEFWLWMKDDLLAVLKIDWRMRGLAYNYCALMLMFFPAEIVHEFIYFQF